MPDRARARFTIPAFDQLRKKFRVRPPGPITVIDLDGPLLRVVQATLRGSRTAVTRIVADKLDWAADADRANPVVVGKAIAKTLARLRLKPASVVMGVPRALVVLRSISLPAIEDIRELASMVHLQISKDLPFPLEEAVIDFTLRRQVSPTPPLEASSKAIDGAPDGKNAVVATASKVEVLVAAVTKEVVEFYQLAANAAGLKLSALGWLSYANARCLEACRMAEGDKGLALVSLRPDEVGIDVIAQQSLLFSRGAPIKLAADVPPASPNPTPAETEQPVQPSSEQAAVPVPENFVDMVTIQVVRSLHSYGGMAPHIPVGKLVVAGVTGHEAAVVEALQARLNLPGTLLDPASALDLPKAAREHAAGSLSALGLALGANDPQGLPLDFLHPKRPAVQRNMRRIRMMMGVAAAAAALIFVGGVQRFLINKKELQYNTLKAELTEATTKRPIYRQMRLQAGAVQNWVQDKHNWLEHYAYLSAVLPSSEDLYIGSLSVSAQGAIRLAVQARSGEVLAKVEKQLRAAGYAVKPIAITPGADRYGCNFRSTVELAFPEDMKIDVAKLRPPPRPADDASLEEGAKALRKGGG